MKNRRKSQLTNNTTGNKNKDGETPVPESTGRLIPGDAFRNPGSRGEEVSMQNVVHRCFKEAEQEAPKMAR